MKNARQLLEDYNAFSFRDPRKAAEMFADYGAFEMPYFESLGVPSRYQGYEQVRAAKSHRPATAKVSRKS